jgi:RHS repeat-associated protein
MSKNNPNYLSQNELITDRSGNPYQYFHYSTWGESFAQAEATQGSFSSSYRFNAKELDQETGNYYYGARYYHPKWSVWLSVDPLASKYPSMSPFVFTGNNPLSYIDPDGNDIVVVINHDGAQGYGHMGMLVGNDEDGWVYMSKDGRVRDPETGEKDGTMLTGGESIVTIQEFEKGKSLEEVLKTVGVSDGYDEALHFSTDSETDATATTAFNESAESKYNVFTANCSHAVEDALEAAGIETGNQESGRKSAITPNAKFRDISIFNFDFLKDDNPVPLIINDIEENLAR